MKLSKMKSFAALLLCALTVASSKAESCSGSGLVTVYTDQESFDMAAPGLALEDFEGSSVTDMEIVECMSPLSSDEPCSFSTLQPGFAIDVPGGGDIRILGRKFIGNKSTVISAAMSPLHTAFIEFSNSPTAVGMNLIGYTTEDTFDITVFGDDAIPICMESLPVGTSRIGFIATQPIAKLQFGVSDGVVIDNLSFGQAP